MATEAASTTDASPKRDAIMAGAWAVFLEHGYGSTTMDAVARAAGVSKATVYAYFPGKQDLFGAAMNNGARERFSAFVNQSPDPHDVEAGLRQIAHAYAAVVMEPDTIRFNRRLVAEVDRFPELGRMLYEQAFSVVREGIADFVRAAVSAGTLVADDPGLAADQFLALIRGDFYYRGLLGVPPARSPDQAIDLAIRTFLAAFGRPA
ncbi:TetR/AcrR family transcriptional regulator [Zavarzinia sp. CC-PAN008]|uniref:TetR/AcrR family transcriptional regulator n=1 Tax=Zavarzinia sp. CC-PAN008 TaxID=3243332 RepID=UPI003F743546